jgi:hypothetical protein
MIAHRCPATGRGVDPNLVLGSSDASDSGHYLQYAGTGARGTDSTEYVRTVGSISCMLRRRRAAVDREQPEASPLPDPRFRVPGNSIVLPTVAKAAACTRHGCADRGTSVASRAAACAPARVLPKRGTLAVAPPPEKPPVRQPKITVDQVDGGGPPVDAGFVL